ncbi:dTDP-4-dehydrorhamnose 3,5-epimerase family protein [Geomonas subterranea]|uniref:dTDP-4-dehydrorhamnose 3,5-epimerase family protein n=1 Tax=Geomonas subterranea TaxID=2847989 RepID=A0ABX8LJX1_9BACT|nr:dTDP-4-dehydrorhamnose 3,5-epimerase family protein [Geomonas subterranea]QXE92212.1 dTDP-4-dehydrorhamnose 3,5-epimerase family protein [Geomonas subterranea]
MSAVQQFTKGRIHDVTSRPLRKFLDERGWLTELFRSDELEPEIMPVMSYISMTQPGVARGPHEHVEQTDYFCFLGPSNFKVYLWDTRPGSPSFGVKQVFYAGADAPAMVVVAPGVVHAYRNIGNENGIVFNAPNRLYAGQGKSETVDEIRHEELTDSPFQLD